MADVVQFPLILLLTFALELAKRGWHQTKNDRITVAHGIAIVALWLVSCDTSVFGRVALGVAVWGWALSRLTIHRHWWRARRIGRWDLWHLTWSPLSSWTIELAVLWSCWPLWTWTSIGGLPVPPWPWAWDWGHLALWAIAGIVAKMAWIWRRPANWGGSLGLRWLPKSRRAEEKA